MNRSKAQLPGPAAGPVARGAATGIAAENARLNEQIRGQLRWQRATAQVTQRLLLEDDPREVLVLVTKHARDISGADLVSLSLPNATGDYLTIETAVGDFAELALGLVFPARASASEQVMKTGQPMIVDNFSADERIAELPRRRIPLGPAVVIPLGLPGEIRGIMTAAQKAGSPALSPTVVELLTTFAAQAGIGLRLAEHHRDAQRIALLADRDRIARDLHDLVIQRLFATGMSLHGALPLIQSGTTSTAADRVRRAVDELDETIRDIRAAIFTLQVPGEDDQPGVRARIVAVADDMAELLGFAPALRLDGALDSRVPRELAEGMLVALREGLANAARHAQAGQVDVTVTVGTDLTLVVTDDGIGIRRDGRRSGLANLTRRAAMLGGSLSAALLEGGGTRLEWRVPLPAGRPAGGARRYRQQADSTPGSGRRASPPG